MIWVLDQCIFSWPHPSFPSPRASILWLRCPSYKTVETSLLRSKGLSSQCFSHPFCQRAISFGCDQNINKDHRSCRLFYDFSLASPSLSLPTFLNRLNKAIYYLQDSKMQIPFAGEWSKVLRNLSFNNNKNNKQQGGRAGELIFNGAWMCAQWFIYILPCNHQSIPVT